VQLVTIGGLQHGRLTVRGKWLTCPIQNWAQGLFKSKSWD
jgi:hypothetical protein